MKTKLLLASLSAFAVTAPGLLAQSTAAAPATAPSVAVTATASVVSQYMFRGLRIGSAGFSRRWKPPRAISLAASG